jgi:plastocyanin
MKKFSLIVFSLLLSQFVFAAKYTIVFGDDRGAAYYPNNLQVNVGDTIFWRGDFSKYPMSSIMVPTGALDFSTSPDFSVAQGDVFYYVPTVAGEYDYECPDSFSSGMRGSFYAVGSVNAPVVGISSVPGNVKPMYVALENGQNVLYSSMNNTAEYSHQSSDFVLNIFDVTGKLIIGTNINAYNTRYVLPELNTGIYIVRVANNNQPVLETKIWQP